MRTSSRLLAVAVGAAMLLGTAGGADAIFSKDELACRKATAKGGAKLAKAAIKAVSGCHKNQTKGRDLALDCNSIVSVDAEKGKVEKAEDKLIAAVGGPEKNKCGSAVPSAILYGHCPAPCGNSAVTTQSQIADCVICLVKDSVEGQSDLLQGDPILPLSAEDAKCQNAIGKGYGKLLSSLVKELGKCQGKAEKGGVETIVGCQGTAFAPGSKAETAGTKAQAKVNSGCADAGFAGLDSCAASQAAVAQCVHDDTDTEGEDIAALVLDFAKGVVVTTTTTSTTSTTLSVQDPKCPNRGELVLWSGSTNVTCSTNAECSGPQTCSGGICRTRTGLDTGWVGFGHQADINNQAVAAGFLECGGPADPTCGECTVTGIDPSIGNCRCSLENRRICTDKFNPNDVAECGATGVCIVDDTTPCSVPNDCVAAGGGLCRATNSCDCYFGPPMPLSAGTVPACVQNRFAVDVTGTADVDAGAGVITASLRTKVHLGLLIVQPCPYCGGKCQGEDTLCPNGNECAPGQACVSGACVQGCASDDDCLEEGEPGGGGPDVGPCGGFDPTANDGFRGGTCEDGSSDGMSCDINAYSTTFPARANNQPGGAGHSLDCFMSAQIGDLQIKLTQSTGTVQLDSVVDCDAGLAGTDLCHCLMCEGGDVPCSSNAECAAELGGLCSDAPAVSCSVNGDCAGADVGPCIPFGPLLRCSANTAILCPGGAPDCIIDAAPCNTATCTDKGIGEVPQPNECNTGICTVDGDGEGQCIGGPDVTYCDGVLKASGEGIATCANNAACTAFGIDGGGCSQVETRKCFGPTITATGQAHPSQPLAAAVFCVGPTSNPGLNGATGLPGPGRVYNQATSTLYCASNGLAQYTPGVGGCPDP